MKRALLALVLGGCIIQQQPEQSQQQQYTQPAATNNPPLPPAGERRLSFNGHTATESDLQILEQLEQAWQARLPDGSYWYDSTSGAAGPWGGPTGGFIQAGLALGGPLPAEASGGGDGNLTGVFVNGRELHPTDVANLEAAVGTVYQGYWWVDGYGNFGQEGGPALGNLYELAQQNGGGGGGDTYYNKDMNGSAFVGGGCVAVSTESGSYYGSGC